MRESYSVGHCSPPNFMALGTASRYVLDGLTLKMRSASAPRIATTIWINSKEKGERIVKTRSPSFRTDAATRHAGRQFVSNGSCGQRRE